MIALAMLLASSSVFASGKITVEGRANERKEVRPVIGFSVYQPLFKRLAWNSWTGYGSQDLPVSNDVHWLTAKNEAQLDFGHGFKLSPGLIYKHNYTSGQSEWLYTLKAEQALW